MPGPLEIERGIAEAGAGEDLRQLEKEVELLFPEGARPHAKQAQRGACAVHPLAHIGLAAVKQTLGLSVERADDLDLAASQRRTQFRQRLGRLDCHLLIADAVEVEIALGAGLVAKKCISRTEPGSTC